MIFESRVAYKTRLLFYIHTRLEQGYVNISLVGVFFGKW
jgi:hypothetical protein